ncbi:NFAT activation molecule 1 isoform X3 [Piliocolobus tephrosceles]|uniref:NFAT activation molecule 1 isoform X3 n=1 Tax=Piliocolobus tephrosceles TaxID=591936 RepID=UPI000C2ABC21|nr:NFAT activation molecule 1 isoform X3 [Piliocolobus tephrosceles]
MESQPPRWRALPDPPRPPGPPAAPRLLLGLLLLLLPGTLRLAGGQSVTHTGLPITASLANTSVSFSCRITYPYTPQFKVFTVSYFHEDLQGHRSPEKPTYCHPVRGTENKTRTLDCQVILVLPGASATGTYYCSVHWPHATVSGSGTFILVREADAGSRDGPHQEVLRSKICQQPQAASFRIRLHSSAAPRDRGLRLHRE